MCVCVRVCARTRAYIDVYFSERCYSVTQIKKALFFNG